jgi:hypothetical protein
LVKLGTGFQPDEIKLMRSALDEAAIILPEAERATDIAEQLNELQQLRILVYKAELKFYERGMSNRRRMVRESRGSNRAQARRRPQN